MLRLVGPLLSVEAKGVFAKQLSFGKYRGQNTVKRKSGKKTSSSDLQIIQRIGFSAAGLILHGINDGGIGRGANNEIYPRRFYEIRFRRSKGGYYAGLRRSLYSFNARFALSIFRKYIALSDSLIQEIKDKNNSLPNPFVLDDIVTKYPYGLDGSFVFYFLLNYASDTGYIRRTQARRWRPDLQNPMPVEPDDEVVVPPVEPDDEVVVPPVEPDDEVALSDEEILQGVARTVAGLLLDGIHNGGIGRTFRRDPYPREYFEARWRDRPEGYYESLRRFSLSYHENNFIRILRSYSRLSATKTRAIKAMNASIPNPFVLDGIVTKESYDLSGGMVFYCLLNYSYAYGYIRVLDVRRWRPD